MHWLRIIKNHRKEILCVFKRLPIKIGKAQLAKLATCQEIFLKRQIDQFSQNFLRSQLLFFNVLRKFSSAFLRISLICLPLNIYQTI